MKKSTLTLSVLTALSAPAGAAVVHMEVPPFSPSLAAVEDASSLLNDERRGDVERLLLAQGGTLQDVIREQIRVRIETGEFGESELGEQGDDDFAPPPNPPPGNGNNNSGGNGNSNSGGNGNGNADDDDDDDDDDDGQGLGPGNNNGVGPGNNNGQGIGSSRLRFGDF